MASTLARIARPRLGLALGGGAARGLAHLGVLEVLEENDLTPAAIAGTSIGALVAGIWLTAENAEGAIDRVLGFVRSSDYRSAELEYLQQARVGEASGWAMTMSRAIRRGLLWTRAYRNLSFVSDENYRHNVAHLLPEVSIGELPIPYAAVASDLRSGDSVVFRNGLLREAVVASGAVPGVMPPQDRDGRLLADGGLTDKIPARALLECDVDVIIGVDVSTDFTVDAELRRGLEIITRANRLTEWHLRHDRQALCDVHVRPRVQDIHWLDFKGATPAIARGREAMEAQLPKLRASLRRARYARLVGLTRVARARRLYESGWLGRALVEV